MIEIDINPNLLTADFIFIWILSWHGFFSFVAVATAVFLVGRWAPLKRISSDDIYSVAVWAIIGGIVGARLVHVVDYWGEIYQHNPAKILNIAAGGIAIWGGILGGLVGGAIYCKIYKYPIGIIADLTAPALLFVQTIGRLGDIVNGEHCAKAADYFLAFQWVNDRSMSQFCNDGHITSTVHPVILFEMVWNLMALAIIWNLRGRLKPNGMLFTLYMTLYSMGRFLVSFLREDKIWALGMQEAHYIALMVLAITIPLLAFKARFTESTEITTNTPIGTRAQRRRG